MGTVTTADIADKWSRQDSVAGRDAWLKTYLDSKQRPDRTMVLDLIDQLPGVQSVVDLGCHMGLMLDRIAERHPGWMLSGVDANAAAVEAAARRVPYSKIALGDFLPWLRQQDAESTDLVMSYYAMAYVPPDQLEDMLNAALRVTRRYLLLAEPMEAPGYPAQLVYHYPEWRHPYGRMLTGLGLRVQQFELPVRFHAGFLNGVLVAQKS